MSIVELRAYLRPTRTADPEWWRDCAPCVAATITTIDGISHCGWARLPNANFSSLEQAMDYTQPVWRTLVEDAVGVLGLSVAQCECSPLIPGGVGL